MSWTKSIGNASECGLWVSILSVLVREGLTGEVAALEQGGEGGSHINN